MSAETIDPRIKKFKKIISIDPYSQKNYEYRDQTLKATDKLSLDNKNLLSHLLETKI